MPSTYSTSLRLELMGTGENRSTWGTKANQVFNMIEDAVAGNVSIAMGDANVTLTTVNGSEDQARYCSVTLTGANTTTRVVTIPTVAKNYIIKNSTTGGFGVTISNGSSSVTVAASAWAFVWTDGTTVYASPDMTQTYVTTTGTQTLTNKTLTGAIMNGTLGATTPSTASVTSLTLIGAGPNIDFTDTDTNGDARIQGNSVSGSLTFSADVNNELANSVLSFAVDGSTVGSWASGGALSVVGGVSATTGTFSGALSATTGTFSGALTTTQATISGATPNIDFTDTDTNGDCRIQANSATGSLTISADVNNEVSTSVIVFQIDGSTVASMASGGNLTIVGDATANGFQLAGVSTASSASTTTFPIGHTILCQIAAPTDRNATLTPRLHATDTQFYTTAGAGTALTGTWRSCGKLGAGDDYVLARRVA